MRYNDFKIVESVLGKPTDDKYIPTINQILSNPEPILRVGVKGEKTLKADAGQQVSSRTDRITGTLIMPDGTEKENHKQSVGGLFKENEWSGGKANKEKLLVKPSHIFPDGRFPAEDVFKQVINNPVLQGTDYGQMVIELAKEIQAGQAPDFTNIPEEFKKAIQDYAGEYLGVIALINGTANFPTRKQWLQHLEVESLSDIEMFFPAGASNPLADSIGYFKNEKTGNTILVSSKGESGAAASMDGLKIPDNLRTDMYADTIKFIDTMQTKGSAFSQPFYGLNALQEISQQGNTKFNLPEYLTNLMPFSEQDIEQIATWYADKSLVKTQIEKIPEEYRLFIEKSVSLNRTRDNAPLGGVIQYAAKTEIKKLINVQKVLPQFEPLAREILQQNFIQIHSRIRGGKMEFDVLWPNKEMATGKITVESKYGAGAASQGKMSFKVN